MELPELLKLPKEERQDSIISLSNEIRELKTNLFISSYHNALTTLNDIIKENDLSGTILKVTFNDTIRGCCLLPRFINDSNYVKHNRTTDEQTNGFSSKIQHQITDAIDLIIGDYEMFGFISESDSPSYGFDLSKLLGKEFENKILSSDCKKIYYKALLDGSLDNQKEKRPQTKI